MLTNIYRITWSGRRIEDPRHPSNYSVSVLRHRVASYVKKPPKIKFAKTKLYFHNTGSTSFFKSKYSISKIIKNGCILPSSQPGDASSRLSIDVFPPFDWAGGGLQGLHRRVRLRASPAFQYGSHCITQKPAKKKPQLHFWTTLAVWLGVASRVKTQGPFRKFFSV